LEFAIVCVELVESPQRGDLANRVGGG
jgi:hypothetical protein